MRGFESMGCGFLLLDGWDTFWLWANMYAFCIAFLISFYNTMLLRYFWLHLTMAATLMVVKFGPKLLKSGEEMTRKESSD